MKEQNTKIGTIISLDLLSVNAQLSKLGFDFIFIDLEHGNVSDACISAIILAKKEGCKIFIRISEINEANIKHALDLACDGIIAPRVECLSEIKTLIDYSYYPPEGKRSIGFSLANQYGLEFNEYVKNFRPLIFPQIESKKGLEIVNEIATFDGISGIFMGPYDLSSSLGVPGQFDSELYQNAYNSVRAICKKQQKAFGTFVSNPQSVAEEIKMGTELIALGVDTNLILNMYQQMLNTVKDL